MPKKNEHYRVGISGSYGGWNLGDEAILQGIVARLRGSLPVEITVFSRDPEDTLQRHRVEKALPVRRMSRSEILPEVRRLDLLVLGGGGILFDGEATTFLREARTALEYNIPVMVYAVGAGPLRERHEQKMVREVLNKVAAITVRDRRSRQLLEEVGVEREIEVTGDPALLLEEEPLPEGTLEREGLGGDRRLIAMSVREPGKAAPDLSEDTYHALLANTADFMVDRFGADVILIPMERKMMDIQHSHAVIARMLRAPRADVLKGKYTSGQILSLMKHFEFVVGMRLHFLIFAALAGVPFVALPYAPKVQGLLEDFKMEFPPLSLVNAGRLIAHIDQSWDQRRSLQTRIRKRVPELRRNALRNNEILISLLTGNGGE